jgi:hypothetical protein
MNIYRGMKVLNDAFDWIYTSSKWVSTTSRVDRATSTELTPQAYLQPGQGGQKLFPFDAFITTSFYPMIEKQFLSTSSPPDVTNNAATNKD